MKIGMDSNFGDFYPRSPCGERPTPPRPPKARVLYFYPRSPCGERQELIYKRCKFNRFLSTLSLRRATNSSYGALDGASISIHALLAESDPSERHASSQQEFLSTLSLRRATTRSWTIHEAQHTISIHALLAESDHDGRVNLLRFKHFYPRSPCGERRGSGVGNWPRVIFLSTLSLRRATG